MGKMNTQTTFFGNETKNAIHFLKQWEWNLQTINDSISEANKIYDTIKLLNGSLLYNYDSDVQGPVESS